MAMCMVRMGIIIESWVRSAAKSPTPVVYKNLNKINNL